VLFAYLTWLERKAMGRMQRRYGPNRAGPFGLLQPIADLVKLVRKEAFAPSSAIGIPYIMAPVISMFTALAAFSVIPFGPGWTVNGWHINGAVAVLPIGLLLIFALGSIGVYGFIVGGWASDSKYSMLGAMRTCAQLVSYEVALALSVFGVVLMGRSLSLVDIVDLDFRERLAFGVIADQFDSPRCKRCRKFNVDSQSDNGPFPRHNSDTATVTMTNTTDDTAGP